MLDAIGITHRLTKRLSRTTYYFFNDAQELQCCFSIYYFVSIDVLLPCMSVHISGNAQGGQKRALDPKELELHIAVNHYVVAGN